jgi:peptidoglycan hydrolase-like protein with peptidoglycan-binding domain
VVKLECMFSGKAVVKTLQEIVDNSLVVKVQNISIELAKELQEQLKKNGFYDGVIDGVVGRKTAESLKKFKEHVWLEYPDEIGKSTALSLLEEKSEKGTETENLQGQKVLTDLGKTGRSMTLPSGEIVYANQEIIVGCKLTWGEYSKGCARIPESNAIVQNAVKVARLFGEIRDKFDSAIGVTSGYRPPSVNRAIGGASRSRHMQGDALDIFPLSGAMPQLLTVVRSSNACGVGLGMRRGFIHIDCRPAGRVVFSY